MDWIIHLFISNFWLLLILFWVLRGLVKVMPRQTIRKPRPVYTSPKTTNEPVWSIPETNPYAVPQELQVPVQDQKTEVVKPQEISQTVQGSALERTGTTEKRKNTANRPLRVSPRDGMMWSEVFGPPRSKQPYMKRRR